MKRTFSEIADSKIQKDDREEKYRKLSEKYEFLTRGHTAQIELLMNRQKELCRYLVKTIQTVNVIKTRLTTPFTVDVPLPAPAPLVEPHLKINVPVQPPDMKTKMPPPPINIPSRKEQEINNKPVKLSPATKLSSNYSFRCSELDTNRMKWTHENFRNRAEKFIEFIETNNRFPKPSSKNRKEISLYGWFYHSRRQNKTFEWEKNPEFKYRYDIINNILRRCIDKKYIVLV